MVKHQLTEAQEAARWRLTAHGWVYGHPRKGRRAIRRRPKPERTLPKAAQDWGKWGVLSKENVHRDLEFLVLKLNHPLQKAWVVAAEIVTAPSPAEMAARFNKLARAVSFHLLVSTDQGDAEECTPVMVADKSALFGERDVVRALWDFYFRNPNRMRLKRCAECPAFFVDYARPNNSIRCSKQCTWRWWSRERRRAAAQNQKSRVRRKR